MNSLVLTRFPSLTLSESYLLSSFILALLGPTRHSTRKRTFNRRMTEGLTLSATRRFP